VPPDNPLRDLAGQLATQESLRRRVPFTATLVGQWQRQLSDWTGATLPGSTDRARLRVAIALTVLGIPPAVQTAWQALLTNGTQVPAAHTFAVTAGSQLWRTRNLGAAGIAHHTRTRPKKSRY
jgi:hypothetical protein